MICVKIHVGQFNVCNRDVIECLHGMHGMNEVSVNIRPHDIHVLNELSVNGLNELSINIFPCGVRQRVGFVVLVLGGTCQRFLPSKTRTH